MMNKFQKGYWRSFGFLSTGLILLTGLIYGGLINNLNLWTDEIYSVLMAKDSFSDMWFLLTTEDSKPPLYYLYLKGILALFPKQYEIFAAHFSSYIFLIIAQIFAATAVRKDYGNDVSLWFIAVIALMPQSLWLAFEVRTYMFSSFLMFAALIFGLRLLKEPTGKDFFAFGFVSVLALYSHYYAAIWLMFVYFGILVLLIKEKKFKKYGFMFLITAYSVALLFAPWLWVPLHTGDEISKVWYVTQDFVRFSWQFFTNPLAPEIFQSVFFIATTFATSAFGFVVLCGLFEKSKIRNEHKRLFSFSLFSFLATFFFLIACSYMFRPMVTGRYLKIFSLIWYMAGAVVLANFSCLKKTFAVVASFLFLYSYADIREISFDKGYQNAAQQIRRYLPSSHTILTKDNTNLWCEYYLPEYNCILLANEQGEVFRQHKLKEKRFLYEAPSLEHNALLSIYTYTDSCITYESIYRVGQNIHFCDISAEEADISKKNTLKFRF